MFITLTQLRNEEASVLQTAIDNTGGKLHVALRGFHYEVGYRNVGSSQGFFLRSPNPQNPNSPVQQSFPVPPGLYTFKQLSRFIAENVNGAQLSLTATNITRLIVPRHIDEFQINEINVDLRTSGFDNEVLSVDACAV